MSDQKIHLAPLDAQALAMEQALKAVGRTSLNPPVGCVIVDCDHNLLATGHTQEQGSDHAERHALKQIAHQKDLEGATVYVTLEPCAHEGQTGSCARMLADLPVQAVYYGLKDPNPLVNGQGIELLKAAGKKVEPFIVDPNLNINPASLIEEFQINMTQQRAFVALKIATSLDGVTAMSSGESQWITSESSRQKARYLRGMYDGVLVGHGTIVHDDPQLNLRDTKFADKKNHLIIIDPEEKTLSQLEKYKVSKTYEAQKIIGICNKGLYRLSDKSNIVTSQELFAKKELNLNELSKLLYDQFQISSIFVEGGAYTLSQFFKQKLWDRYYQFIAPKILGSQTQSFSKDLNFKTLSEGIEMRCDYIEDLEKDILIAGVPS